MNEHDDLLGVIRDELRIAPSSTFEARVLARVETRGLARVETGGLARVNAEPARNFRWRLLAAAAGIAALVIATVMLRPKADDAPAVAPAQAQQAPQQRPGELPLYAELHDDVAPVSPARGHSVAKTRAKRPAEFNPFAEVLVPEAERRGFRLFVQYEAPDGVPFDLKPLSAEEPVRIVALNDLPPIRIMPVQGSGVAVPATDR